MENELRPQRTKWTWQTTIKEHGTRIIVETLNRTDVKNINQRRSIKLTNHKNEAAIACYQISGNIETQCDGYDASTKNSRNAWTCVRNEWGETFIIY